MKKYLIAALLLIASTAQAAPVVRISAPTDALALNEETTVTIAFSEPVTGFTLSDLIIYGGGGEFTSGLSGNGTSYTVGFRKTTTGPTSLAIDNNSYSPSGNGITFGFNRAPVVYINSGPLYNSVKIKAVPQPRHPYPGERLVTTATGLPASCVAEKYYTLEFVVARKTWFYKEIPQKGLCRPTALQSWALDPAPKPWDAISPHGMHNHSSLMPKVTTQEITRKGGTTKYRVRVNNSDIDLVAGTGHVEKSGAFRTNLESASMSKDDPIIYPNQKGAAHHHTYYGNTSVNYQTNSASLLSDCVSAAAGGRVNCTGYWQPSMIDTAISAALDPFSILVYYKTPPSGVSIGSVEPFPQGLKIIAGNPSATTPTSGSVVTYDKINFTCLNRSTGAALPGTQNYIPSCKAPTYTELMVSVEFPPCVADDGSGGMVLDSPNHRSHLAEMSNPLNGTHPVTGTPVLANWCPTSHPHVISFITVSSSFEIKQGQDTATWRLASDNYSMTLPGGYSLHQDWWGMWDPYFIGRIVSQCNNKFMDCGVNYIGMSDGIDIESISVAGTTATITTAAPHHLPIGTIPPGAITHNFAGTAILGRISGVSGADAALYNYDPNDPRNSVVPAVHEGGDGSTRYTISVGSQPLTVINATQISYTLPSAPTDTLKNGAEVTGAKLQWGESLCGLTEPNCPADYYNFYYN